MILYILSLRKTLSARQNICGRGGIGRRARFRSVWANPRGGSSPLDRTNFNNEQALEFPFEEIQELFCIFWYNYAEDREIRRKPGK